MSCSSAGYHSTRERKSQPTQSLLPTTHSLLLSLSRAAVASSLLSQFISRCLTLFSSAWCHYCFLIVFSLLDKFVHVCSLEGAWRLVEAWWWICRSALSNMTAQLCRPPPRRMPMDTFIEIHRERQGLDWGPPDPLAVFDGCPTQSQTTNMSDVHLLGCFPYVSNLVKCFYQTEAFHGSLCVVVCILREREIEWLIRDPSNPLFK